MSDPEKFSVYYEGQTTRVAADRSSTEHHVVATFDTKECAQKYALKRSTVYEKYYSGKMTKYEWDNCPRNTPHNPR